MTPPAAQPLVFEPLFKERVWGGRRLETLLGKKLPPDAPIGESWEISDRPEAQSVVREGPLQGQTLHGLWTTHRREIFGDNAPESPRFPILAKLLDAREKLSLQVHPPAAVAASFGGESKNEFWYFLAADPGAKIFAGVRSGVSPEQFERALAEGTVTDLVGTLSVATGDSFYLPSGRLHAIGEGNLIVEIQQNSDTTYRVFDWDRTDADGKKRDLHVAQSLRAIRFDDCNPGLCEAKGEELLRSEHFTVEKWELTEPRRATREREFALVIGLSGRFQCKGVAIGPGDCAIVPGCLEEPTLEPCSSGASLLRVTF
jgi:mannose-6-phosphate isomerase